MPSDEPLPCTADPLRVRRAAAAPGLGRRRCLQALSGFGLLAASVSGDADAPLQWDEVKERIRRRYPAVPQLSVPSLHAWLNDTTRQRPLLLDTRAAVEFEDGHLTGAIHVEALSPALQWLRQRPAGVATVLYCSVGHRSSALADALLDKGQTLIFNLEGSLFEWANAGHAVVTSEGRRAKVHPYNKKWGSLLRRALWSRVP